MRHIRQEREGGREGDWHRDTAAAAAVERGDDYGSLPYWMNIAVVAGWGYMGAGGWDGFRMVVVVEVECDWGGAADTRECVCRVRRRNMRIRWTGLRRWGVREMRR